MGAGLPGDITTHRPLAPKHEGVYGDDAVVTDTAARHGAAETVRSPSFLIANDLQQGRIGA